MIRVVLFCNLEHSKTTHTFEVFPFKNTIREQSVTASLHREMIRVVLVVGSTPAIVPSTNCQETKRNFIVRPLKPHSTIIARISKISIELDFQNVRGDVLTVVIVCLFRRLHGCPFVCCLDVLVVAVYCFDVFVIACVNHKVVSSFTFKWSALYI